MNVSTVLDRLVAAAKTAVSTPALTLTAYGYTPDKVTAPCVYVVLDERLEFDLTMGRGLDKLPVKLRVLASRTDDRESQRMLFGFMSGSGASSIKAAVEAARGAPGSGALAGACDDLHVRSALGPRWFEHGGESYLGCEWSIDIYGSGA